MAMGRPKAELVLSEEEQAQLQSLARSRSLPAALVRRANIVLACAAGATNSAVAQRFGTTNATVGKWRRRFVVRRIAGLDDLYIARLDRRDGPATAPVDRGSRQG